MKWKRAKLTDAGLAVAEVSAPASNFPAFAPIVSDAFEQLKNIPEPIDFSTGAVLLEQDAEVSSVYLLRRGLVKLLYVTADGRETTLGLRTAGWYAGAVSALTNARSIYSVKAVTPCVVSRSAGHSQIKTLDALPLLKQMELAQLLSITPEHLSRLLQKINVADGDALPPRAATRA
jgi:hypothetical protein